MKELKDAKLFNESKHCNWFAVFVIAILKISCATLVPNENSVAIKAVAVHSINENNSELRLSMFAKTANVVPPENIAQSRVAPALMRSPMTSTDGRKLVQLYGFALSSAKSHCRCLSSGTFVI